MFSTTAMCDIQQNVLAAATRCLEPDDCQRWAISTSVPEVCVEPAVDVYVVGELRVEQDNRIPCCPVREFVDIEVYADVPKCEVEEGTMRSPEQMVEDTCEILAVITGIYGGIKGQRFLDGFGVGCQASTAPAAFKLIENGYCYERWRATLSVEITDWLGGQL